MPNPLKQVSRRNQLQLVLHTSHGIYPVVIGISEPHLSASSAFYFFCFAFYLLYMRIRAIAVKIGPMSNPNSTNNAALAGKIAIVTGGGHGAGAAIARLLAAAGARVAVNDINPDRARRVAEEIRAAGGEALDVMADVSNRYQCVTLIETTRAEWGRLDILVNYAGVRPTATVMKMDEWELERCLHVNLMGPFYMSQLVGRVLADQNKAGDPGGMMINIAVPEPEEGDLAAYAATQVGLPAFSRACAREFAPLGVAVHTLVTDDPVDEVKAIVL